MDFLDNTVDHLMFDFETLSRRPNAALLSVAMLKFNFDEDGIMVTSAIKTIFDPTSNFPDSHYDPETIAWWIENVARSPDIVRSIIPHPDYFNSAVKSRYSSTILGGSQEVADISQWIEEFDLEAMGIDHIWCNGPGFDGAILESHLVRLNSTQYEGSSKFQNLGFYKMRDIRTICKMSEVDRSLCEQYVDKAIFDGKGRKHDPLFDCWAQLGMLAVALKKLSQVKDTKISYRDKMVVIDP